MSPEELVDRARGLVAHDNPSTRGLWARAAATLARQAVEARIRELLTEHAPGARAAPMRSQLLCLETVLRDRDLARRLSYAWHRLSAALHHHAYELPPTAEELEAWLAAVRAD